MLRVCITEKPSVARDIASVLGATTSREGFYEGPGVKVTWTYGHLCTLKEPADYFPQWKPWTLGQLPMIPPRFGIKLIDNDTYKRQFAIIAALFAEADEIINCGDAGQEGELIQRWVLQMAGHHCPVKRLWISSLTDDSIREGFRNLRPSSDFDNLYHAGLSRAIGDWLLGMNATRLYSQRYGSRSSGPLSIGRVQTPTLALLVQRHMEIANFKPENFWELKTVYRQVTFSATKGRFKSESEAQAAISAIASQPFTITGVNDKKGKESPPRLFDLTSLQVECNKRWGWTADETLRYIQQLYEKKVTTYPRVDTTYLSDDLYPKIPVILDRMKPYAPLTAPILAGKIIKTKKIFDNAKVTDHHAIIPTGESPAALTGPERPLYHLIATRFIAAFYPDCEFTQTTVTGRAADVDFKASGKVITKEGWRAVLKKDPKPADNSDGNREGSDSDDDGEALMPPFTVGESGPHEPALQMKTTQPPKYYTEGTLLRAMETAGRNVDDETLREAMKENGIGRPSTRAAIIEILTKRQYVYRVRKNLMVSQRAIDLIDTINEELLKSPTLTGIWENKLRQIERGTYQAADFLNELKQMITQIVYNVLTDSTVHSISAAPPPESKKSKTPKK